MRGAALLLSASAFLALIPACAHAEEASNQTDRSAAEKKADAVLAAKSFSTGVARGRDLLDSAISTSGLSGEDLDKYSARSISEILRNIPGLRVNYHNDEAVVDITVRGLPIAGSGNKYIQVQEDGLPVLEFGDLQPFSTGMFLRADTNLASVETIRGGSASTFASNSPGGVINLISRTGEATGGLVRVTKGLDFGENRLEMDYGTPLGNGWRFHVGGFYRKGDGPRNTGIPNLFRGGQIKFNVTKEFDGGFVRVYGKWLDDHGVNYTGLPIMVSGTNDSPVYKSIPNFSARDDSFASRNFPTFQLLDRSNQPRDVSLKDQLQAKSRALAFEAQYNFSGWNLTNKFRYARNDGTSQTQIALFTAPANIIAQRFGGAGATLTIATGPDAGKVANPATLGGNGLLAMGATTEVPIKDVGNVLNDVRASKVWKVGGGDLTVTSGLYYSRQHVNFSINAVSYFQTIEGNGNSTLVDVTAANGTKMTQGGIFSYGSGFFGGPLSRIWDARYRILAPYGSLNYRIGKLAIGGSVRQDYGQVRGTMIGAVLGGGRAGFAPYDWNGDNVFSMPEIRTSVLPLDRPAPVRYNYKYTSYSTGVNYRLAQQMSLFARYSHGARASADRILFTPVLNFTDGSLAIPAGATSPVDQAEAGVKYRSASLTLNLTGFWAQAKETDAQYELSANGLQTVNLSRLYRTHGAEFEGSVRSGIFSISAGATYTHARIAKDSVNAANVGNKPRRQPDFLFQVMPQINTSHFDLGANILGTTSTYSHDSNQLKIPGYTIVSTFVAWKPNDRITWSFNANNLFDTLAITELNDVTVPQTGIAAGRFLNWRTVSTSIGYSF